MSITRITMNMLDPTGFSNGQVVQFNGTSFVGAASSSGARQSTQTANTSSGTNTYNFTFPWVIGQCYIEYLNDTVSNNNGAQVVAACWVNMRSYSGTKTADVSNRYSSIFGVYDTGVVEIAQIPCDRGTSGTVLTINRAVSSGGLPAKPWFVVGGGGPVVTFSPIAWQNSYSLRVTAWEDTQS